MQICALAGYYLNPDLKAKYGADLVEVPDEAAMLDKLVAGDCVAGTELRAGSGGGLHADGRWRGVLQGRTLQDVGGGLAAALSLHPRRV